MISTLRTLSVIVFVIILFIVQTTLGIFFDVHPFEPNLVLPIAIYYGVTQEIYLVRSVFIGFIVGYLYDAFSGNLMGINTLISVAVVLIGRGAAIRLITRGVISQISFTFLVSILVMIASIALYRVFARPNPFAFEVPWRIPQAVMAPSITTALVAPFIFSIMKKLDPAVAIRREESKPE